MDLSLLLGFSALAAAVSPPLVNSSPSPSPSPAHSRSHSSPIAIVTSTRRPQLHSRLVGRLKSIFISVKVGSLPPLSATNPNYFSSSIRRHSLPPLSSSTLSPLSKALSGKY
ncbi:hypothetical protein RIF29_30678 [Crotalaria pallida]|uniref:Uncharacterized protein n=1 Tax=Crotalaria pallida TaxID=3830 RepID=A0AAN9EGF6_CROPI